MQDKTKQSHPNQRMLKGQSMIEMALMLPFLLVMIVSAVELGRLFFTKIVVTNAAREGAYYLSTHISDYDIGTGNAPNTVLAAEAEAMNSGISDIEVEITPINCCLKGAYSVKVTVETTVDDLLILGFLNNVFTISSDQQDFTLSSSVEMMVQ